MVGAISTSTTSTNAVSRSTTPVASPRLAQSQPQSVSQPHSQRFGSGLPFLLNTASWQLQPQQTLNASGPRFSRWVPNNPGFSPNSSAKTSHWLESIQKNYGFSPVFGSYAIPAMAAYTSMVGQAFPTTQATTAMVGQLASQFTGQVPEYWNATALFDNVYSFFNTMNESVTGTLNNAMNRWGVTSTYDVPSQLSWVA